jgi:uncharacterized tellurite resistance protein B-like protein
MPTQSSQTAVLDDLIQEMGAGDIDISEAIKLSPPLVQAACLLYTMASDGKIQEQESSQLQQVIGGNDGLLAHALAYVKAFPVEKFLEDAPSVLSQRDKHCIMANVCDSMLADGNADKRELEIFETFREAFDLQKSEIDHIIDTVTLKNNKNIFGEFELITSDKLSDITPHLAMAVSIVYMMSADGTIGQEEIGQLETMIGEFEGLQQYALQFVRKVKRSDFLNQAKHALDKQQRLCVLLNVCDSMMSDESVGMLEDKLFVSMLDAFSVKESAFKKYYEVLELKNIKPFDVSDFEYSIEHVRALSQQEQKGIVVEGLEDQSEVGDGIQRTMDSNTERVTNDFGSSDDIHKAQENATHELEKQRFLEIKVDPNLQKALGGSDADKNIQAVNGSSSSAILKTSPLDDRVENLQKVVDELSQKLNKFETKNKSLLNNVRASTNKESSREPAFENQESKANKAKVANAAVKDNLQSLASQQADETNKTTVAKEAIRDNKQAIASSQTLANKATVAKEAIKDNNQALASSAVASNKAGVKKEAIEDNKQAIASSQPSANKATVAKEAIKDNNQAITSSAIAANKAGVKKEAIEDNKQAIASSQPSANKATVAKEAIKDNNQSITSSAVPSNKAGLAKEAIEDNLQPALDKVNIANKATVAKEAIKDNNQAIASSTVASNKARVKKEAIEDNLQSIAVKPVNANDASVAKVGFSSNRQPVANGSQILDASIASNPANDAPVNISDALEISSVGVFASQSETDPNQSSAETQIETSAAMEAPITFKKRQSPIASIFRNKQPSKYSFKFYARVLATFFVMSLWTSNIAATRLDMGSMVFGHLMRISPDQLDLR